jgi:hypothetical protein
VPRPAAGLGATLRGGGGGVVGGFGQNFDGDPLLPNEPPADMRAPDVSGAGQRQADGDLAYSTLTNDVFTTRGKSWRTYTDHRHRTVVGEPRPLLVSNVTWVAKKPWAGLPGSYRQSNEPWKDYLGCCHPPVTGRPGTQARPFRCSFDRKQRCALEDGIEGDPLQDERRWSPRRGAAAVTHYDIGARPPAVFVLGGRARTFEKDSTFDGPTRHEKTRLMSDVWVSYDEGETWDFRNVGCWVLSENTATFPTKYTCSKDADCFGDLRSTTKANEDNLGDVVCGRKGYCVCRGWSPREFFAAAVNLYIPDSPMLYIAGGVGASQGQLCGGTVCGDAKEVEGFTVLYSDVWRSREGGGALLGTNWEMMVAMDTRSGYSLLMFADKRMLYLTGMGFAKEDNARNKVANTVSISILSQSRWEEFPYRGGAAGAMALEARAGALGASDLNALYLFGGMEEVMLPPPPPALSPVAAVAAAARGAPTNFKPPPPPPPPPDPYYVWSGEPVLPSADFYQMLLNDQAVLASTFQPSTTSMWYKDFENPAQPVISGYIYPHWPLAVPLDVLNVSAIDAAKLADKFGIKTARQLASITRDQVLNALDVNQANIAKICLYLRAAQAFCYYCSVQYRPFAGFDDWSLFDPTLNLYVPGAEPNPPPAPPDDGCTIDNWSTMASPPAWAHTENTVLGPFDPATVGPTFRGLDYVCRSTPPPRRNGAMAVMDGVVYVAGGMLAPDFYVNDLWYRDDVPPVTTITTMPGDTATTLDAMCSEGNACLFEARFYDGGWTLDENGDPVFSGALLRDWALLSLPYDVININGKEKPTTVHIRAVDAAGNKDLTKRAVCCTQGDVDDKERIVKCRRLCRGVSLAKVKDPPSLQPDGVNVFTWTYVPPFPTATLIIAIFGFLLLCALIYWLRRRYLRKKKLAYFARRRVERARRAKERERRKLKKIKKIVKVRVMKKHRPKVRVESGG